MNTNILLLVQEVEALETDINTLLELKESHPASPDLIKTIANNIISRTGVITYSLLDIKDLDKKITLDNKEKVVLRELVTKFFSLILSKLLLKIILCNSGNTEVSILLLDCINNKTSGIIPEITKYIQILDSVCNK